MSSSVSEGWVFDSVTERDYLMGMHFHILGPIWVKLGTENLHMKPFTIREFLENRCS